MTLGRLLVLVMLLSTLVVPSVSFALEGFPGATWGELRLELPRHGKEDAILQGWIRQGVDLKRWSSETYLMAYGTVRYTWDSKQNTWWNDVAPGAGISFNTYLTKQFPVAIGAEYLWDRFFVSPHTEDKAVLYTNWYGWWDLSARAAPSPTTGFPGATWGELRLELPRHGKEDAILQGWIRQGVDLKRWSSETYLMAYGTVRYTWDSKQNTWWNDVAPGAGISFNTYLTKQFPVAIGVEYLWDRFFVSPHTEQKVILYVNWYGWWDLGKK